MLICLPLPRSVYVQRFGLWNDQDHEAVLEDVQKMETVEQLELYMCINLSRLSYFPRGLVKINPINNFKCLFEIDVVQLLWYVYDNSNSQCT